MDCAPPDRHDIETLRRRASRHQVMDLMTKEQFLDECRRVAAEMNATRKANGSTVDLTSRYYADVGASAWATIWQAI